MTRLIRFLLSHLVLLVVAGFVAVGILYRGPIFGLETEVDQSPQIDAGRQAEPATAVAPPSQALQDEPSQREEKVSDATPGARSETDSSQASRQVFDPDPATQSQEVVPPQNGADSMPQAEILSPDSANEPTINDGTDGSQTGSFSFRPLNESGSSGTLSPQIEKARRAYWDGDTQRAIVLYQAFLNSDPKHPYARGELGGIYFKSGRLAEAASEFRLAAELLSQEGANADAKRMIDALATIDPESARQLAQQLALSR